MWLIISTLLFTIGLMYFDNKANPKSFRDCMFLIVGSVILFLYPPIMVAIYKVSDPSDILSSLIRGFSMVASVFIFVGSMRKLLKLDKESGFKHVVFHVWLSRKDLELGKRWWHRLISVVFFCSYLFASYYFISWNIEYNQQYSRVSSVSDLFSDNLQTLTKINKNTKYVISDKYPPHQNKNSWGFELDKDNTYCSNKIEDQEIRDMLKNNTEISQIQFYLRDERGHRFDVVYATFLNYLKENNVKCVAIDSFTKYGDTIFFLEPFNESYYIYEFSFFWTGVEVFGSLVLVTLVFLLLIIFYYKIFLYIIFGGKR